MQYVAMLMLVVAVAAGGWGMWQKIKVEQLISENQRISIERDAAQATARTLEEQANVNAEQIRQFETKIAALQLEREQARKQVEYTRGLFNDHDFADLMAKKPGLITNRMQKASDKVLSDLELATQ